MTETKHEARVVGVKPDGIWGANYGVHCPACHKPGRAEWYFEREDTERIARRHAIAPHTPLLADDATIIAEA